MRFSVLSNLLSQMFRNSNCGIVTTFSFWAISCRQLFTNRLSSFTKAFSIWENSKYTQEHGRLEKTSSGCLYWNLTYICTGPNIGHQKQNSEVIYSLFKHGLTFAARLKQPLGSTIFSRTHCLIPAVLTYSYTTPCSTWTLSTFRLTEGTSSDMDNSSSLLTEPRKSREHTDIKNPTGTQMTVHRTLFHHISITKVNYENNWNCSDSLNYKQ